jgi:3D (Asp-Asp-Asp) domain-containing protein
MKNIALFIIVILIGFTFAGNLKLEKQIEELEIDIQKLEKEKAELLQSIEKLENEIKELEKIKIFEMEATAYTDDKQSQGKWVGQTATGVKPQIGVVAVDPKVIPLGTRLYVEGYGQAIAGDTGGAIKGNKIDLFLPNRGDCMRFGRQKVKVRVVE